MRRFTLLRVDLSKGDDDPALAAIKKKYGADTLPAVRIVSPDGAIVARTDELPPPTASSRCSPPRAASRAALRASVRLADQ